MKHEYKEPKVSVLQASAKLVLKWKHQTWNERFWFQSAVGANILFVTAIFSYSKASGGNNGNISNLV